MPRHSMGFSQGQDGITFEVGDGLTVDFVHRTGIKLEIPGTCPNINP